MEQCCGPLEVEIFPGKHCDFSTYLEKRARAQSDACADVQFPDYGTELWSLAVEMIPGNHCYFITNLAKRARVQSGACAEVKFPDYGMRSGPLAVEMVPEKHCNFSNFLGKEGESSVWRMRRSAVS
jgi:hypothetical protein